MSKRDKEATYLSSTEQKLIAFIRSLKWGHFTVIIRSGEPVRIEKPVKDIKLDD
jgi:hypothetical protein